MIVSRLLAVLFLVVSGISTSLASPLDDALVLYMDGKHSEAMAILKPLADGGNADAQYFAGSAMMSGLVAGNNPVEARKQGLELINKAAAQRQPDALHALSQMYFGGHGVPKNEKKGLELLRQSVELGNPVAQYLLGKLYMEGQHVPKNRDEAIRLFKKSSDQDFPLSLNELAAAYASGPNKNLTAAFESHRRAADLGYVSAMREVGIAYQRGAGTARSDKDAVKWLERAAEQHDTEAQYRLGMLYRSGGIDIKKDPIGADQLIQAAAKMGHAGAKAALSKPAPVSKKAVPLPPAVPATPRPPANP